MVIKHHLYITGKPVIASNWSGQVDFLKDYSILLPGELTEIHASAADKFLLKGSKWFTVNYQYASAIFKDVTENYKKHLAKSKQQMRYTNSEFTLNNMATKFVELVDRGLENVPQEVSLNLPKLKKVEKPTLKLPKLKKVEA